MKDRFLVPAAIRYARAPSAVETFSHRLAALEARVTWKPRPYLDVVERIDRLGAMQRLLAAMSA